MKRRKRRATKEISRVKSKGSFGLLAKIVIIVCIILIADATAPESKVLEVIKGVINQDAVKRNPVAEQMGVKLEERKQVDKNVEKENAQIKWNLINEFDMAAENFGETLDGSSSYTADAGNEDEFVWAMYIGLVYRKEEIVINYYGGSITDIKNRFDDILDRIYRLDNTATSDDFDFLQNDLNSFKEGSYMDMQPFGCYVTRVSYHDNAEQVKYCNEKIKEVLNELKLDGKTDYEKIRLIYDWVTTNVAYDESLTDYSAYGGLKNGKTVCQGYSLILYKMLTQAGFDSRIIRGDADNGEGVGGHAWNIVKLNDVWYNLDSTWDAGMTEPGRFGYFLVGSDTMNRDHFPDTYFKSDDFLKYYNISKEDYE